MEEAVKQKFESVDREIKEIKGDIKDHEGRIRVAETGVTRLDGRVDTLCEDMKVVKDNSRWAVRLLVAIILGAILKSVLGI